MSRLKKAVILFVAVQLCVFAGVILVRPSFKGQAVLDVGKLPNPMWREDGRTEQILQKMQLVHQDKAPYFLLHAKNNYLHPKTYVSLTVRGETSQEAMERARDLSEKLFQELDNEFSTSMKKYESERDFNQYWKDEVLKTLKRVGDREKAQLFHSLALFEDNLLKTYAALGNAVPPKLVSYDVVDEASRQKKTLVFLGIVVAFLISAFFSYRDQIIKWLQ